MHCTIDEKIARYATGLAIAAAVFRPGGSGLRMDRKWREWVEANPAGVDWVMAELEAWRARL